MNSQVKTVTFSPEVEIRSQGPESRSPTLEVASFLDNGAAAILEAEQWAYDLFASAKRNSNHKGGQLDSFRPTQRTATPPSHAKTLQASLRQLVDRPDFDELSVPYLINVLTTLIEEHRLIPVIIKPRVYVQERYITGGHMAVTERIKLLSLAGVTHRTAETTDAPLVGFVAYVGSPLDGEMIIANSTLVNEWLRYIRKASETKLVRKEQKMVSSCELSRLFSVVELPMGRHQFTIDYRTPADQSTCDEHFQFRWDSIKYPCSIMSCKQPSI